ncbi:MAG: SAM-dependent methyltransferase [Burkholderiales bacterium PBB4]|nr:MAG: SAM-dependent methyltransferase [Burkholderiales bacterium PBB4]
MTPGATVLDVACGSGRHLQWFAQAGHTVVGVDQDIVAAQRLEGAIRLVQADLENQAWPLMDGGLPRQFDAVVVTNYLWRPLFPVLLASLAPGGVLLYETFAIGNAAYGRPSRPDFLLKAGELLQVCQGLHVVAYENGLREDPLRCVQRIAAIRPQENSTDNPVEIVHALSLKWTTTL